MRGPGKKRRLRQCIRLFVFDMAFGKSYPQSVILLNEMVIIALPFSRAKIEDV